MTKRGSIPEPYPNTKTCPTCGNDFARRIVDNGKGFMTLDTIAKWRRRIYCSHECCRKNPDYRANFSAIAKKLGYGKWALGRKATEETKLKMSLAQRGHKRNVGIKQSIATRQKRADAQRGEKSHFWRGGLTPKNKIIRASFEYKEWRNAVLARDNHRCVLCGAGGEMNADHIRPFALFPSLRLDLDNGRALCVPCHEKTPTYLKSRRQMADAIYGKGMRPVKIIQVPATEGRPALTCIQIMEGERVFRQIDMNADDFVRSNQGEPVPAIYCRKGTLLPGVPLPVTARLCEGAEG